MNKKSKMIRRLLCDDETFENSVRERDVRGFANKKDHIFIDLWKFFSLLVKTICHVHLPLFYELRIF